MQRNRKWCNDHPDKRIIRTNRHNRRSKMKIGKITLGEWQTIKEQQGFRCYWCKRKFKDEKLEMDHVI